MNGRVYDYNLGRFLSVDPFIQEPGNSQSMNPYSYIMNNPLAGTDPTGYVSETKVKEISLKVKDNSTKTGTRIKGRTSEVTAKVTTNSDGSFTIEFSGSNGAAVDAAAGAVSGALASTGDYEGLASTNGGGGVGVGGAGGSKSVPDLVVDSNKIMASTNTDVSELPVAEFEGESGDTNTSNQFIFGEDDSKDILEYFFKDKMKGIKELRKSGRVLATDIYHDAYDIHFKILSIKDAMGNPLSKNPSSRAAKSSFSWSEMVFNLKLLLNPSSSVLETLQRMQPGLAARTAIASKYKMDVEELKYEE